MSLTRYHRQMLLQGFGPEGQRKLQTSTALLLGCGALGSVAADMLARAGVGRLVIVDRDVVELTNLQRQVLFDERDVADQLPKAIAAKHKLAAINSAIDVVSVVDDISHRNIESLAADADILIDGLDNFETRYLANDVAVKRGLPYIYGAAVGTTGMLFPFLPFGSARWDASYSTPCFRCLFEEPPEAGATPTCDTVGVIGPGVAVVANLQVTEALKILTGNWMRVNRRLVNLDFWSNDIFQLDVSKAREQGNCPTCKMRRFDYLDGRLGSAAEVLCGRDAVQLRPRRTGAVDLDAVAERLADFGQVRLTDFLLSAELPDGDKQWQITLFPDGRALVKGTQDVATARSVMARFVGG